MTKIWMVVAGAVLAALAIWHPAPHSAVSESAQAPSPPHRHLLEKGRTSAAAPIVVYVVGAVRRPGLYRLAAESRADDAVRLAGGETADADAIAVNLAARVADGDEVAVPRIGETVQRRASGTRTRSVRRIKSAPSAPVDLNTASAADLGSIPGIGPTIAERIVEIRERDGPFASLDELLDVAGMTPAKLDRIGAHLIVR